MNSISNYVDLTAELIHLPIDSESRPGVIANLEAIAEIAQFVTEFPLDEAVESAAIFHPLNDDRDKDDLQ